MPREYSTRTFAPFHLRYSSVTFAPLLRSTVNFNHANYLLRDHELLRAHLRSYGILSQTISELERTIDRLYDARDQTFRVLATEDFIREIQPLLWRHHRETNRRPPQPIPSSSSSSSSIQRPDQPRRPNRY